MVMYKKIITVLSVLLIALMALVLISCEKDNDTEATTTEAATTEAATTAATTTAVTTTPVTTSAPEENTVIAKDGKTQYMLVYPKDSDKLCVNRLARSFKRFLAVNAKYNDDSKIVRSKEIVVGCADREGVRGDLESGFYGYELKNGKVYIFGGDDTSLFYAVESFIDTYLKNADGTLEFESDFSFTASLTDYTRENWQLSIPAYEGGLLEASVYNCGAGFADDSSGKGTIDDSYMHYIAKTTATSFENYLSKLESFGFVRDYYNKIEDNLYARYTFGDIAVYTYYIAKTRETRVIEDRSSNVYIDEVMRKADVTYTDKVEFYQYSLDYTKDERKVSNAIDCGMFYIVKLADSSLLLIDSGHATQATAGALKGMHDFLYEITGKKENEKLDIAAWYFTHPDGDHVTACYKLIEYMGRRPHGVPNIDAFLFNFPAYEIINHSSESPKFKTALQRYYPDAKYLKILTGMTLKYPGLDFEVVYTHDAAFSSAGFGLTSANDTCSVVALAFDGCRVMMLGDVNRGAQKAIVPMYSSDYFKSDMVQASHHTFNVIDNLYKAINAPYVCAPNSYENAVRANSGIKLYSLYAKDENIYYGGEYTYKFVYERNAFKVTQIDRYDKK